MISTVWNAFNSHLRFGIIPKNEPVVYREPATLQFGKETHKELGTGRHAFKLTPNFIWNRQRSGQGERLPAWAWG